MQGLLTFKRSAFVCSFVFCFIQPVLGQQEPQGGLYPTTLVIFADEVNSGVDPQPFGAKLSIDRNIKHNGSASWRWDVENNDGVHVLWGGWGKDTTVFWVHQNSHVSFWLYATNENTMFKVMLGFMDGQFALGGLTPVGARNTWRYFDLLVPSEALGKPLNEVKVLTFSKNPNNAVLYFDNMKISNVRLYAGKGAPEPIQGVFADQIGYDVEGIKTFSAEQYEGYAIVRESDKKVMYSGTDTRFVSGKAIDFKGVWVGDFTGFQIPGRYFIKLNNGKQSYPFNIGFDVYDATLRAAIRFFYYQRNNTAITMPYAEGPWIHDKDEFEDVLLPGGNGTKTVRHGWHDAGDLAVYMPNHSFACFWLAAAWDDFRYNADDLNIPESGDGYPDLLNELHWGLDWTIDMQDQYDGGFYHNMCVRKDASYQYGKTTPTSITGYELTNKTTSATAVAVGVLAYAARLFEEAQFDLPFVGNMKEAAIKGWGYLDAHPTQISITEGCTTYQDPDDIHARFFAACALLYLTGSDVYNRYAVEHDPGSQWISDFNNQTNLGYLLFLKSPNGDQNKKVQIRSLFEERARETNIDRVRHPFGFVGYYYWGSLGTAFARAANYCIPDWILNQNLSSMNTTLQQLHYTFGQNSLGLVYFSGFGTHSMSHAFHHWLKTLDATPHNFPGMLPGGPNEHPDQNDISRPPRVIGYNRPSGTPIDSRYADTDSWSTNEIAVNQSAQLVYVLAAAHSYAHKAK